MALSPTLKLHNKIERTKREAKELASALFSECTGLSGDLQSAYADGIAKAIINSHPADQNTFMEVLQKALASYSREAKTDPRLELHDGVKWADSVNSLAGD